MLRELNENEMMMVSGGSMSDDREQGSHWLEPTMTETLENPYFGNGVYGLGDAPDEIIVNGTRVSTSSGWGKNGDRGFFEQVGNILDNPATETGALMDLLLSGIGDLHGWLQSNNLYGCFAPIRIHSSCG